jgi:signal transduction histidine kinase/CheY-like chemotaxis protein
MLYVGIRQKAVEQRIRQVILRTTVGKTGYIYVLGSRGEERGQYIISYKGERDGEYIWDTLDSNGNYVIRDIIAKATSLGPEELATVRYLWQNTGEEEPRWKIARLVYYKPWDWVIGTSVYEDELQGYWAVLRDGHSRITKSMLMAGLLLTLGTGILGVFVTWRMTRPIEEMRRAAERIIKGDFDQRVTVSSADEIGLLARSFNFMTERLRETMDGLRRSRDELEEMVAQRTAQLEAAKRNAESASEAKTAFLANMSHELRTPLNAVLGFTELMRIDPEVTPKQMESLEIITRSGEHLLALINNVLEISRIETGRMTILEKETDLFQLLHETQSLLQVRAAEKGLSFTLSLSPDLPRYVITDSGKLRQILINLIGNAIKYTERGGVTLRAAVIERESAQRAVISFMVEDTGIGIRAEDRDKLFLPFVRLEEQPPGPAGSGLGLALTKQYVEQMHGTINFTSAPGRGSVFHFEMPFSVIRFDELPQEPLRGRPVGLEEGQPHRRLLIVEDNAENRLLLRNFLEPFGFEVFEVVNGQEALDFFDELKPDLIWMDIRMPSMDGIEATRRIRARPDGAGTRIIALTAHALEDELHAIIAAGCDGFIRKPYREAEIIAALETHLRLRFLYSEETPQQRAGKRAGLTGIESWLSVRLERLPRDLLRELSESVLLLDRNLCVEKIGKIGELDQELAVELRSIVDRRQYGELLSILERISGEVEG